jgi:hypothetical protein
MATSTSDFGFDVTDRAIGMAEGRGTPRGRGRSTNLKEG